MYLVTETYREQMDKPLRNMSYVRIVFGIADPDAPGSASLTDNGHLPFSDAAAVDDSPELTPTYQTLEHNRWILDGKNPLCPDLAGEYTYQGYAGIGISTADCIWDPVPVINISFADYFQLAGLTLRFDESMNEHPAHMKIVCYEDDVEVLNRDVYPDKPLFTFSDRIPSMNRMELRFLKSCRPYRRPRLTELIYGIVENLSAEDIVSCRLETEMDTLSSKLPACDFEFVRFDTKREFDPENPTGVWKYLESGQSMNFEIGYGLDDGTVEWVPMAKTFSTGDPSVERTGVVTEVKIKAKSILSQMTLLYDRGVYAQYGKTLYDLTTEIAEFSGYGDGIAVHESLKRILTKVPMPKLPANQCLQLIANAACCGLLVKRDGTVAIEPLPGIADKFRMDYSKMTQVPSTKKYPVLRKLTTEYRNVFVETAPIEAVRGAAVENAEHTEIEFTHAPITNHLVSASAGLTVISSVFYAEKTVLVLTGTGTVTVTGNEVKSTAVKYVKVCGNLGDDLEMSNELLCTQEDAAAYANWIATELSRRNEYAAPNRGYPELDVGDMVSFITNFENEVPVTLLKNSIEFNGVISGEGKYLIGGGADAVDNSDY